MTPSFIPGACLISWHHQPNWYRCVVSRSIPRGPFICLRGPMWSFIPIWTRRVRWVRLAFVTLPSAITNDRCCCPIFFLIWESRQFPACACATASRWITTKCIMYVILILWQLWKQYIFLNAYNDQFLGGTILDFLNKITPEGVITSWIHRDNWENFRWNMWSYLVFKRSFTSDFSCYETENKAVSVQP